MPQRDHLNLLMIDDNQLYAEQLVALLERYFYQRVTLGFLDDKEELIKHLRQPWDVLIMGKAYDLSMPQVNAMIAEQGLDLPMLALIPHDFDPSKLNVKEQLQLEQIEGEDITEAVLPLLMHWGAVDALPKDRKMHMAIRVFQLHGEVINRRELAMLRQVLSDAEQRANILIKNSKSAVAYIEDGLHIYANEPYLQMFGFKSLDDLLGVPVVDLIASNNIADFKQFLRDFERGNRENVEFKFESIRHDGTRFAAKLQLAAATYEGEPCLQVIIQPNEQANSAVLAEKLAQAQRRDSLTGLVNRRGFEPLLTKVLNDIKANPALPSTGLLAIRIDNLGKINSTLGIMGVDSIVTAVAEQLRSGLLESLGEDRLNEGYLSRFSDSTFLVLLPAVDADAVQAWATRLIEKIGSSLFEVGQRTISVSVSIGATLLNANSPSEHTLIDRVNQAVVTGYKQTNSEGGGLSIYDPSAMAGSDDAALVEALKIAISQNKFALLYQPVYDVERDVSNLFEVFLRLPLADGSQMSPDKFIDIATEHGLMEKIDRWVLIQAAKELKHYRQTVDAQARVLVHLSTPSLLDSSLPAFLTQLNKAVGATQAGAITVQFNESAVNDYLAAAARQSHAIQQTGSQVGIYGFGSGVNSVGILQTVQPNLVRLDRSYVKDLSNADNVSTISGLIRQANEQGVDCLMAFIEDPAAMSAAWTVGARYLQGDYLQARSEQMMLEASG